MSVVDELRKTNLEDLSPDDLRFLRSLRAVIPPITHLLPSRRAAGIKVLDSWHWECHGSECHLGPAEDLDDDELIGELASMDMHWHHGEWREEGEIEEMEINLREVEEAEHELDFQQELLNLMLPDLEEEVGYDR